MKTSKKIIAVLLSMLMLFSCLALGSVAADSKKVRFINYNVAGLPDLNYLLGKEGGRNVNANQKVIGKIFNEGGFDVVAVQEDFTYHSSLVNELTEYTYKTEHTGGIPGGDGMNIYSRYKIYNCERTKWNKAYGVINDGADEMTPKGILYCVLDLGDGVLVDFYDIHADAFSDKGSCAARRDNFRQLSEIIKARGTDRPVVVTGDYNNWIHAADNDGITEYMLDGCGFKSAWVEVKNDGNYKDFSKFIPLGESWGVWDSVENFFYRDGGGVKVTADSFEYEWYFDGEGKDLSDHAAAICELSFEKGEDFKQSDIKLSVPKADKLSMFLRRIIVILTDLFKGFAHFDEAMEYLGM